MKTILDSRDRATILAALRYWQREGLRSDPVAELVIATNIDEFEPLAQDEIDTLWNMLNRASSITFHD